MNFSVFIPIGSVPIVLVSSAEYLTQTKCVLCRSIMVVSVAGAPKGFRKNLIEYRNYQSEFNHFFIWCQGVLCPGVLCPDLLCLGVLCPAELSLILFLEVTEVTFESFRRFFSLPTFVQLFLAFQMCMFRLINVASDLGGLEDSNIFGGNLNYILGQRSRKQFFLKRTQWKREGKVSCVHFG